MSRPSRDYRYINPNHAMEISEFIGRTITLFHLVDSRIPQRINLKMLPKRNAG
ncbi:MAG: hypothetical protein SGI87_00870 [Flavobacteriales bacterium]|nr:hypothetical protein [Flavobacteriales bacterium]